MILTRENLTEIGTHFARELLANVRGDLSLDLALIASDPDYLDRLLNEHEAAAFLDLKVATLRSWRCRGDGPKFFRPSGKCIKYTRRDLIAYKNAHTVSSTSELLGGLEA